MSTFSTPRKLILGCAAALLIISFLPWYHASATVLGHSISASATGWHDFGPIVWIVDLALIGWELARVTRVAPAIGIAEDVVTGAGAALCAALGAIFFLTRVTGTPGTGIGGWLGLPALAGLGYGAARLLLGQEQPERVVTDA